MIGFLAGMVDLESSVMVFCVSDCLRDAGGCIGSLVTRCMLFGISKMMYEKRIDPLLVGLRPSLSHFSVLWCC